MKTDTLRPTDFLAPRYWPTWLGLGVLRLLALLPWGWQLRLGRGIGRLMHRLAGSRRRIAETNVRLCFPELSEAERQRLVKRSFEATGISLFEAGLAWWGSDRTLRPLYRIEGIEHLAQAREAGKGTILLGGHYTTLEISGRLLSFHSPDVQPIYKRAHNPLFDAVMGACRRRHCDDVLSNTDMRGILRALRKNKIVWIAPDQDFGRERAVFAPFMGVTTATLTSVARLARLSGAPVLPFYSERLPGTEGFVVRIEPPLQPFPSEDDVADASRINEAIAAQVRACPEQYLWIHKRFKTRPVGEPDPYAT